MNRPCPLYRGWSYPLQALLHVQLGVETKGNPKHAFPSKETSRPDKTESDSDLPVRPALNRRSERPTHGGLTGSLRRKPVDFQILAIFPILILGAKFGCKHMPPCLFYEQRESKSIEHVFGLRTITQLPAIAPPKHLAKRLGSISSSISR